MSLRERAWRPLAVALLVLAVGSVLVTLVRATDVTVGPVAQATLLARALAAPLFLAGGVLRLARWRITDESHCGLRGSALLLMGGICLPSTALARSISAQHASPALVPFTRALTVAAVLYVAAVALSDEVVERTALERRVVGLAVGTAAACVTLMAVHGRIPPDPPLQAALAHGVVVALAVAWSMLAAAAALKGRHGGWTRRAAPMLACMGVAELFRLPGHPATTLVAAALTVGVGAVVAGSALHDLVQAAQQEHDETRQLSQALELARVDASTRDNRREELTHDVRGTLAGIRAAMATLERYGDRIDTGAADRLRGAALGELAHLEHLLVGRGTETPVAFELDDVLTNVVDARRAAGLQVSQVGGSVTVRGVPGDLATVVQNLLVNAQQHAPEARVSVVTGVSKGRAVITVADDGPGISPGDVTTLFERGHRGAHSRGSGLGLYIARALVRQHDGEITLQSHVGGTTFAVSLPLASAALDRHSSPSEDNPATVGSFTPAIVPRIGSGTPLPTGAVS